MYNCNNTEVLFSNINYQENPSGQRYLTFIPQHDFKRCFSIFLTPLHHFTSSKEDVKILIKLVYRFRAYSKQKFVLLLYNIDYKNVNISIKMNVLKLTKNSLHLMDKFISGTTDGIIQLSPK